MNICINVFLNLKIVMMDCISWLLSLIFFVNILCGLEYIYRKCNFNRFFRKISKFYKDCWEYIILLVFGWGERMINVVLEKV